MFWKFKELIRKALMLEEKFLCDSCRYDYGDACTRPERPNARRCPDYKKGPHA